MKKLLICVLLLLLILYGIFSLMPEDEVLHSLGKSKTHVLYSEGGFQDYTDYGKYHYASVNLSENPYFAQIQETDLPTIHAHLDDFESRIDTFKSNDPARKIVVNYDFNRELIDCGDYFYLESKSNTWSDGFTSLVKYDLYFFDIQTQTLYFFHNNI